MVDFRFAAGILWLGVMTAIPQQAEPPQLNPQKPHIRVYLSQAPDLRFYQDVHLGGTPAIEVNDRGAFVDGALVCGWPGGAFDRSNEANRVLGYTFDPSGPQTYKPCPEGLPIVSKWAGFGGAALYIEVSGRRGRTIEVRFRGRRLYLGLDSLPGKPCAKAWSWGASPGGVKSWVWEVSEVEGTRWGLRSASRLRGTPAFAAFMKDVTACLTSSRAPGCFVRFVQAPRGYSDVGPDVPGMTAQQFVEATWSRTYSDGRLFAEHMKACFIEGSLGAPSGAGSRSATLTTDNGWTCDLVRTRRGWKLAGFFQNPDAPTPGPNTPPDGSPSRQQLDSHDR